MSHNLLRNVLLFEFIYLLPASLFEANNLKASPVCIRMSDLGKTLLSITLNFRSLRTSQININAIFC